MYAILVKFRFHLWAVMIFMLFILLCGCGRKLKNNTSNSGAEDITAENKFQGINSVSGKPQDKLLAGFQNQLLELAFATATAIPLEPHVKDRSLAQENVVTACLELQQPVRALNYTEKIADWRLGLCFTKLALYCSRNGYPELAKKYASVAEKVAGKDFSQEWRKERIKAQLVEVYTLLDQSQETGSVSSDPHKTGQAQALPDDQNNFDKQVSQLDGMIALQGFETTKAALQEYAGLYNRYYDNPQRRGLAEEKIKTSWGKLPVSIRIELLMNLTASALKYEDSSKARSLIDEAQVFLDGFEWPLEHRLSITAKLIRLRFQAGDKEKAKTYADAALAIFDKDGKQIVDIYRAGTLRPLAEAYQIIGDTQTSLSIYRKAVDEGATNINSRPRAEDLSATCCSMALSAVEPDAELWTRIHDIAKGLGNPW